MGNCNNSHCWIRDYNENWRGCTSGVGYARDEYGWVVKSGTQISSVLPVEKNIDLWLSSFNFYYPSSGAHDPGVITFSFSPNQVASLSYDSQMCGWIGEFINVGGPYNPETFIELYPLQSFEDGEYVTNLSGKIWTGDWDEETWLTIFVNLQDDTFQIQGRYLHDDPCTWCGETQNPLPTWMDTLPASYTLSTPNLGTCTCHNGQQSSDIQYSGTLQDCLPGGEDCYGIFQDVCKPEKTYNTIYSANFDPRDDEDGCLRGVYLQAAGGAVSLFTDTIVGGAYGQIWYSYYQYDPYPTTVIDPNAYHNPWETSTLTWLDYYGSSADFVPDCVSVEGTTVTLTANW